MLAHALHFEHLTPRSIRIFAATPPAKTGTKAPTREELPRVIVTANRREEYLQDVPITVQAITGDTCGSSI